MRILIMATMLLSMTMVTTAQAGILGFFDRVIAHERRDAVRDYRQDMQQNRHQTVHVYHHNNKPQPKPVHVYHHNTKPQPNKSHDKPNYHGKQHNKYDDKHHPDKYRDKHHSMKNR